MGPGFILIILILILYNTYKCTSIHQYIYTSIHLYIHTYTYIRILRACVCSCAWVSVTCMHLCVLVCLYVCKHARMPVWLRNDARAYMYNNTSLRVCNHSLCVYHARCTHTFPDTQKAGKQAAGKQAGRQQNKHHCVRARLSTGDVRERPLRLALRNLRYTMGFYPLKVDTSPGTLNRVPFVFSIKNTMCVQVYHDMCAWVRLNTCHSR